MNAPDTKAKAFDAPAFFRSAADAMGGLARAYAPTAYKPIERAANLIVERVTGRLICAGMGKSGQIAKKAVQTFSCTGTPAMFVHPAEGAHGDLGMLIAGDGLLLLSKSGKTQEIFPLIQRALELDAPIILVSENTHDGAHTHSTVTLDFPHMDEAWGKLPTISTLMQLALIDALAIQTAELRGFTTQDYLKLHPGGSIGRAA